MFVHYVGSYKLHYKGECFYFERVNYYLHCRDGCFYFEIGTSGKREKWTNGETTQMSKVCRTFIVCFSTWLIRVQGLSVFAFPL